MQTHRVRDGMKFCLSCRKWKLFSQYGSNVLTSDKYTANCLQCIGRKCTKSGFISLYNCTTRQAADAENFTQCLGCLLRFGDGISPCQLQYDWLLEQVTGVICANCNSGASNFKFNLATLQDVLSYLQSDAEFNHQRKYCQICLKSFTKKRYQMIHLHPFSDVPKGVLCHPCLRGLRYFEEDPHRILRVLKRSHSSRENCKIFLSKI